jgi:hypothetical protein
MQNEIDPVKFAIAHEAFLQRMEAKSNGIPFVNFQHPFLIDDEIAYKWKVYADAKDILQLSKWAKWKATPGKILDLVKDACKPTISQNLLEHKYGFENSSEGALYKVTTSDEIIGLENQLFDFFLGGKPTPDEFAIRFDNFADYLRSNHLGCNWAFIAYLSFLLQPQVYFPIRPSHFEKLLKFYGIEQNISGFVSWERYSILLELAESLKSRLAIYGTLDSIEIQSYMWVVSYLVAEQIAEVMPAPQIDFNVELENRIKRATEKERIGLLGEQFIYEQEKSKLNRVSRQDLANKVKIVSPQSDFGYDILSFDEHGQEIHVEVKTTSKSENNDDGFWLSDYEKQLAEKDSHWKLYRVWNINAEPHFENLGNIFVENLEHWQALPSNWYVKRKAKNA